ncbi:YbjQ family protein [Fusobacterium varium]
MLITTTESLVGYEIEEYLGHISETVTFGINDFKEFFLIADFIGGESSIYNETLEKAKEILNKKLKEKAESLDANAIIGLRITYSEMSGKDKSMLLLSGTGTAVAVEMKEEFREKIEKRRIKLKEMKKKKEEDKKLQAKIFAERSLSEKTFTELKAEYYNETSSDKKVEIIKILNTRQEVIKKKEEYKNKDTLMLMILKDAKDILAEIELYNRSNK